MKRLGVALVALALVACGGDGDDRGQTPIVEATASPTASSAPLPEQRIVPVNGDLAEVVYALGLGDQVVATDISATYPPEADETPKIGYQRALTVEPIMSFEPTIVLADDLAGPPEVLDALERLGVKVARIPRESDLDAISTKIHAVADALGVPARGDELAATFEAELAAAEERAADAVAESGRPKVLALYLRGDQVQLAFGRDSGVDAIIDAAGGTDVGTLMGVEDTAQLSLEAVVEAQPDVLLVTTSGLESVGGIEGLSDVPGLDQTPAVADGRIATFEDQYLYGLGPRTGQLVDDLVDAFHP